MLNHPTQEFGLRREQPIEKAARLLIDDRVHRIPCEAAYEVVGDTGTYRVLVSAEQISCPCPARTPLCAHVLAVAQAYTIDAAMTGVIR